jgi:hypothetical protein
LGGACAQSTSLLEIAFGRLPPIPVSHGYRLLPFMPVTGLINPAGSGFHSGNYMFPMHAA